MLVDDRSASVSLPEMPLLAVLPGTGGLTRVTDKRKVRRDLADAFCTIEEGVKGKKAVEWRLVDEIAPKSQWEERVQARAEALAETSSRPDDTEGVKLTPLERDIKSDAIRYSHVGLEMDREAGRVDITLRGPGDAPPASAEQAIEQGAGFWPLALARELDDAILHLRANEPELGILVFRSEGEPQSVLAYDAMLEQHKDDWFINETRLLLKRVLKRVDLTSRSLLALIEPGSCFAGTLAEIVFAADRSVMLEGVREGDNREPATLGLSALNFGAYPMSNGLTRLETRFLADPANVDAARKEIDKPLDADAALELGLVTYVFDDIDWEDEVRIMLEERKSFLARRPDRHGGPIYASPGQRPWKPKIFGRLTAWQNWIFQRENAVGEAGALSRYGTGLQPDYDKRRV